MKLNQNKIKKLIGVIIAIVVIISSISIGIILRFKYKNQEIVKSKIEETNQIIVKCDTIEKFEYLEKYQDNQIENYGDFVVLAFDDANNCYNALKDLESEDITSEVDSVLEIQDSKLENDETQIVNDNINTLNTNFMYKTELGDYLDSLESTKEIKVALLDTGVSESMIENNQDRFIDSNFCSKDSFENFDDNGHGTEMADIILQNTNKYVKILPVKVANSQGKSTISNLCNGIEYAIEEGVVVINISMNAKNVSESETLTEMINEAISQGIIVVVSAGNNSMDVENSIPANIDGVVTVSAVDNDNNILNISNYGEKVEYSSYGTYGEKQGTSYAAANVSGTIADALSKEKTLEDLNFYFVDLGEEGKDNYFGNGLVSKYVSGFNRIDTEDLLSDEIVSNYQDELEEINNEEEYLENLNEEEDLTVSASTGIYAILYQNSEENYELHFQNGDTVDETKGTVLEKYEVADSYSSAKSTPWYDYGSKITTITSDNIVCPASTAYWFAGLYHVDTIDVSGFDTSNVTNMGYMFSLRFWGTSGYISYTAKYDYSLKSLDLTNFDTSKVTNMCAMFEGCRGLRSLDISNFDTSNVTNMSEMFSSCTSLTSLDISNFDTSNVTNMKEMFYECNLLTNLDLSKFDTSNVTNMKEMFCECNLLTNLDLSKFDTSNVTDMYQMFCACSSLTSLDISKFDTSKITSFWGMFCGCKSLTSLDLSSFDTSNVTRMYRMFDGCKSLTNLDLSSFNTSKVTDMSQMFDDCWSLTSLDLSNFDTSNVTNMSSMFYNCNSLTNLDLSNFDTSKVTSMGSMFCNCYKLASLDISKFDTSKVTSMGSMFCSCYKLASLDVSSFDTSNVTDMSYMFYECNLLTNLDLSNFDTSNVASMNYMFYDCNSLTSLDLSEFDTNKVTNMEYIFVNAGFNTIKLGSNFKFVGDVNYLPNNIWERESTGEILNDLWNSYDGLTMADAYINKGLTAILYDSGELHFQYGMNEDENKGTVLEKHEVADSYSSARSTPWYDYGSKITIITSDNIVCPASTAYWFVGLHNVDTIDVSGFDTSNVASMNYMFSSCTSLTSLDVSSFDTSNVTDMSSMFYDCSALTSLDVSNFNISNVTDMSLMFYNCSSLINLDLSNFDTSKVTNMSSMFYNCGNCIILGNNTKLLSGTFSDNSNWIQKSTKNIISCNDLENMYSNIENVFEDIYWKVHNVKFDASGGMFSKSFTNVAGEFGTDIKVSNPIRLGYTFLGWYDDNGNELKEGDYVVENTYTAHWAANNYTLILKSNGTDESDITIDMKYGEFYTLSENIFHKDGYVLSSWNTIRNVSGISYLSGESVGNLCVNNGEEYILYAQWTSEEDYVTVTFETDGGSEVESKRVLKGSTLGIISETEKEGYTFINWHINSSSGTVYSSSTIINEDTTLYAEFKKNPIVTFVGGIVSDIQKTLKYGGKIGDLPTYPVTEERPQTLIGWFTEEVGGTQITSSTVVTEDVTYYAHFGYEPQFNTNGGKITSDKFYPIQENSDYTFKITPENANLFCIENEDYYFAQSGNIWISNNKGIDSSTAQTTFNFTVPENNKYTISYSVSSQYYYDRLTLILDGVTIVNGISGTQSGTYDILSGDHTLVVKYSKNGLGNTGNDCATITFPSELVLGTDTLLPTIERDGYNFLGWFLSDGLTRVNDGDTVDLSKGAEIQALWEAKEKYTVTLDVNGGTYSSGKTMEFYSGDTIQGLHEPSKSGYKFIGWKAEDGTYYKNGDSLACDLKLTAEYVENNITISFDPTSSVGTGIMDGKTSVITKKIPAGTSLNIIPGAKLSNYYLEGWYTESNGVGEKLTESTIINEDITYYAHYLPVTETYTSEGLEYIFGAEWSNQSNSYVDNVNNNLEWHYTGSNTNQLTSSLHIHFELTKFIDKSSLSAGSIVIKVPKYIWKSVDEEWVGTTNISTNLPAYPNTRSGMYFSYIDGNDSSSYSFISSDNESSNYYYLVNNQELSGGAGLDLTINYDVYSYQVSGGAMDYYGDNIEYIDGYDYYSGEVIVKLTIDKNYDITLSDSTYLSDIINTKILTNEMHTYVKFPKLTYMSKDTANYYIYYTWNESWGTKPKDADDYFYVDWCWQYRDLNANQSFSITWSEDTAHDGTLVGWGEYRLSKTAPTYSYPKCSNSSFNYFYATMKYPKTMLANITNNSSLILNNSIIFKTIWQSGYEEEGYVKGELKITNNSALTGEFSKRNGDTYSRPKAISGGNEDIVYDNKNVSMDWSVSYYGGLASSPITWDEDENTYNVESRTIELKDGDPGDIMYSSGSATSKYFWEPSTGNEALLDNDYYISSLNIYLSEYDAYCEEGIWSEEFLHSNVVDYNGIEIYIRYENTNEWVYYKTIYVTSSSRSASINLPSNVVGYKIKHDTKFYNTSFTVHGTFIIKPTEHIKSLISADMSLNASSIIKDKSVCYIYKTGEDETNAFYAVTNYSRTGTASNVIYELTKSEYYQYTGKKAGGEDSVIVDAVLGIQDEPMTISAWNYNTSSSRITQISSGIFYDLLPVGTDVDESSINGYFAIGNNNSDNMPTSGTVLSKELYLVEFISNWENSNRTMMKITCNAPEGVKATGFVFKYNLRNTYANIIENGASVENDVAFVNTSTTRMTPYGKFGEQNIITDKSLYDTLQAENSDYITYAKAVTNYTEINAYSWGYDKSVKSDSTNGMYVKEDAETLQGKEYTYKLELSQSENAESRDIVFYDILEYGKNELVDGIETATKSDWYGTFKSIDISEISEKYSNGENITKCKPVIYYSTKARESFNSSDYDINNKTTWTDVKPENSQITAIAIDCSKAEDDSDFILKNKDTMSIYVTMESPNDENGFDKNAYNTSKVYLKQGTADTVSYLESSSEITLKGINIELHKTSDPIGGTLEEPEKVYIDTALNYILEIKNLNENLSTENIIIEDTIPEGLVLSYDKMKFSLNKDSEGVLISNSPRASVEKENRKLIFTINKLEPGETAYITIPTIVNIEEGLIINTAKLTSIMGLTKDIDSESIYHEAVKLPSVEEKTTVKIKKVDEDGNLLAGAKLKLYGKGIYEADYEEVVEFVTSASEEYELELGIGNYKIEEEVPTGYQIIEDVLFDINDVTKEKEVEIINKKQVHTVTIHHYIEGTTTQVELLDGTLATDEILSKKYEEEYTTSSITPNENYELVSMPTNAIGIMGTEDIEVIYYYKLKERDLTITKVGEDGTTPLEGAKFEIYDASKPKIGRKQDSSSYYFIEQDGKYSSNNQKVNNSTANSYFKIDLTAFSGKVPLTINAEISSESNYDFGYATVTESTSIPAYNTSTGRFVYISGTVVAKDYQKELDGGKVYYLHIGYRKDNSANTGTDTFTINSITLENGGKVYECTTNLEGKAVIKNLTVCKEYTIEEIQAPEGYKLADNKTMTLSSNGTNEITIQDSIDPDQKKTISYQVKYFKDEAEVEEDEQIENQEVQSSIKTISVDKSKINIIDKYGDGYILDVDKTGEIPTSVEDGIIIYVYYKARTDLSYTVNYLEKDTDKVLSTAKVVTGQTFGDTKAESPIDIDGYVKPTANQIVTITTGENVINFYYTKRNDLSYTVNYLEKDTNTVLSTAKVLTGQIFGDTKTESAIDIDGYVKPAEDKSVIITTGENVINFYYTKRTDLGYTVNYLEKDTNTVLSTAKVVNGQTFGDIKTESPIDIDGYVKPTADQTVTITIGENVINFYYTKRTDLSYTVNYLEKDTDKVLSTAKVVTGQTFGDTKTESPIDIDGYVKPTADQTVTITTGENVINFYYTKRDDLSYTVNYFKDGVSEPFSTENYIAKFEDEIEVVKDKTPVGYKQDLSKETNLPLTISTDESKNVINIYYIKDEFNYAIKYYYDGILDDTLTDSDNKAEFGTVITTFDKHDKEGYELVNNDYKLVVTENSDSNVLNIYYVRKSGTVKVHYYLEGTTTHLSSDVVITGKYGDAYSTNGANLDSKYEFVKDSGNTSGTYNDGIIEVIYEYKVKDAKINVNYLDKNTGENLKKTIILNGKVDEKYETKAPEIEGYTLLTPGTINGTYLIENDDINIYYAKTVTITTYYIDVNKVLDENGGVLKDYTKVDSSYVGDEYTATSKEIPGYILVKVPDEETITVTDTDTKIVFRYYYKKVSSGVLENHIDEYSGKILYTELHKGNVGDEYSITSKEYKEATGENKEFKNYVLDESTDKLPTNDEGTMEDDLITVNYYYKYNTDIKVKYIDKATGEEIKKSKVVDGFVGEDYSEKEEKIDGYKFVECKENNSNGKFDYDEITVTFLYLKEAKVVVKYIDDKTGEEIEEETTEIGTDGEKYNTNKKDIENYDLIEVPVNKEGDYNSDEEQVVIYKYVYKTKVLVKNVDIITGNIISEVVEVMDEDTGEKKTITKLAEENITGHEGDTYTTNSKEFDGYEIVTNYKYYENLLKSNSKLLEENNVKTIDELLTKLELDPKANYVPENYKGTMEKENDPVIYYYVKISKGVVVNYLDVNSNEKIADSDTLKGNMGDKYTTKAKDIDGYDLVQKLIPDNANGEMIEDETVVNYYYSRIVNVVVKYVNEKGIELKDEKITKYHENDKYEVSPDEITDYEVKSITENYKGQITKDDKEIVVVITYKQKEVTNEKTNPQDNNGTTIINNNNNITIVNSNDSKEVVSNTNTNVATKVNNKVTTPNTGDNTLSYSISTIILVIILNLVQVSYEQKVFNTKKIGKRAIVKNKSGKRFKN